MATPLLTIPQTLLFDWHGTLVDTQDAMISALQDTLPEFESLGLLHRLQPEAQCLSDDDVKLVRYIRIFRKLHPRILVERRISRTEIFNALFGSDIEAKSLAHRAYNRHYRSYFGQVRPFQEGIREYLLALKRLGLMLGVATNRSREFFNHELRTVDDGSWPRIFDMTTCADEVTDYKPDPQILRYCLAQKNRYPQPSTWYIGDSFQDMVTAHNAGVTAIFYNGGNWDENYLEALFSRSPELRPDAIINSFEGLMDLLQQCQENNPAAFDKIVTKTRPPAFPPPRQPAIRVEPDWHPAVAKLTQPAAILFDWHATLVDTLDAMYRAVDDMLPTLAEHGLLEQLVPVSQSKSPEDARLVDYVREYACLHPKIKADRKISRTDIFEVLFGDNEFAKKQAHKLFNHHYRNHFGTVLPFEANVRRVLEGLQALAIPLGVITNRDREFFVQELATVEQGSWSGLFETVVCGDDTVNRKPHPDQLDRATRELGFEPGPHIWYVGDSTTDMIASAVGNYTGVFFNGAQWDLPWLNKIFPGTERFPHRPDVVVNDFSEFWALVLACLRQAR